MQWIVTDEALTHEAGPVHVEASEAHESRHGQECQSAGVSGRLGGFAPYGVDKDATMRLLRR
jgi:hypothetical protein